MDMSDVFLNNCANFPFIIFVVGGQEPGGVRAGAVHAGHAAGPLPGLLDGAMAESGDGRSAATRWTWRSSGRGAPCGMRWTCSSSMSLATARCCPYIFTDIFNNDLSGPYAFLEPPFVQRSLLYKIQARRKNRIQITVSLSASTNTQTQNIFPFMYF
ncbi:uncharacterized protein [Zea mays]|uniref:uncharacterized protein n=1 Tax=Zea mays TaxID=4577 RepID=UPI0004DE99EA|nr:uncharacterized protein LOC103637787 [Zea mays]|eukprot:XP_008659062.1 uncharacterized protein LOC103637787 [Zea mays]